LYIIKAHSFQGCNEKMKQLYLIKFGIVILSLETFTTAQNIEQKYMNELLNHDIFLEMIRYRKYLLRRTEVYENYTNYT
jgi:hypothetical protein